MRTGARLALAALAFHVAAAPTAPATAGIDDVARLLTAYPDHLSHIDGKDLVWRDGTRMAIDDGQPAKSHPDLLSRPDLKDMFRVPYPAGPAWSGRPQAPGDEVADPGRARHAAFFAKMYGDCTKGTAAAQLVDIIWLPATAPQKLKVTRVNGVARKLEAVSRELEALPAAVRRFLSPAAGTYVCRPIAGTERASAHGYGIAIDIAIRHADYWRWQRPAADRSPAWRNRIPMEIVEVFERHGFIWGGKWLHYDTMHFEYRPELLPARP